MFRSLPACIMLCTGATMYGGPSRVIELPSPPATEIRLEAINPWMLTHSNLNTGDLDKTFDSRGTYLEIKTTDPDAINAALAVIAAATFTVTSEKALYLDLRYRVTLVGPNGVVKMYSDAVGNVLQGGRVLRYEPKENWLLKVWNVVISPHGLSYAPMDKQ